MDASKSHEQVANESARVSLLMRNWVRSNAVKTRTALLRAAESRTPRLVRFAYKPFDDRWLLWGGEKLLNEWRPDFYTLVDPISTPPEDRNLFLVSWENARVVYGLPGVTTYLGDLHYRDPFAKYFPLRHRAQARGFLNSITRPNVAPSLLSKLAELWTFPLTDNQSNANADESKVGEEIFFHVLATLHTPNYVSEYEDVLSTNWAKIPIPASREVLAESASLGRRIAELLRTDLQPEGVLTGVIPPWIRSIARPGRVDNDQLRDPEDFGVTVNYSGAGKVVARPLSPDEAEETSNALEAESNTNDVYWNAEARWSNVPSSLWEFGIGGFPVLKKWLGDRHRDKLGRPLSLGEVQEFSAISRRLAALVALGPELNAYHEKLVAGELVTWSEPGSAGLAL